MQTDCSCHEKVVVLTFDSTVRAVLPFFVKEEFVEATCIALDIQAFTNNFNESRNNHRLCSDVGMEAVSSRGAFGNNIFAGATFVKVRIYILNLIKDELGLVALDVTELVVSFESVALDDEQRVVIESGDTSGFPSQEVDVDVAVPLSDDDGFAAFGHEKAVEDDNNRPVGFMRTSADIDDGEISVGDALVGVDFGECPNPKSALLVLRETEVCKSVWAVVGIGVNVADEQRRTARMSERLDAVLIEDSGTGVDESFDIVRRVFGSHNCMVVAFGTLEDIPIDCFEGSAFLPQPPKITAGLFAVGKSVFVITVFVQGGSEVDFMLR